MSDRLRALGAKASWIVPAAAALIALILLSGALGGRSDSLSTDLEKRLARVLSRVEGAGEVEVLVHTSAESDSSVAAWNSQEESVIGVIVVARGADDAGVASRLAQAAATALGIDQTRIEVFAMGRETGK